MQHERRITFRSADGVNLVTGWIYTPEGTPRGVIQISHGMCEYFQRYHRFIADMVAEGFVVCGNDHIGHGDSSRPENYGYFGEKNGYRYLVADLHQMTTIVKKEFPQLPYFLFGHSMGSFIARLYLARYGRELDGAIICGTGGSNPLARLGVVACSCTAWFRGGHHRSHVLDRMAFGSFNKKCHPQRTDKDWLTRDEAVVDRYLQDPRCSFSFTACGYRDLSRLSILANHRKWFCAVPKELPILLIAGDKDPVGHYGKGVDQVYRRLNKAGVEDVSIHLYPDARHELFNERNYDVVYKDVNLWLNHYLSQ